MQLSLGQNTGCRGSRRVGYHDGTPSLDHTPKPDPGSKFGVGRVANIILHQVASQPIGEVEELVIKGDKDVCDEGWHFR